MEGPCFSQRVAAATRWNMAVGQNQWCHLGVGEFTTRFRSYSSGWIGMFTGGTIWLLTHGYMRNRAARNNLTMAGRPPELQDLRGSGRRGCAAGDSTSKVGSWGRRARPIWGIGRGRRVVQEVRAVWEERKRAQGWVAESPNQDGHREKPSNSLHVF